MKLLLVAGDIPDADTVREVTESDGGDVEVYVVAPALEDSPLRFWVSDVDDAIERARATQDATAERLDAAGARIAAVDVGEAEPLQAAQDALAMFPADKVLILTHEDDERAYREDELDEARRRLDVPVEVRPVARS